MIVTGGRSSSLVCRQLSAVGERDDSEIPSVLFDELFLASQLEADNRDLQPRPGQSAGGLDDPVVIQDQIGDIPTACTCEMTLDRVTIVLAIS
jgi:hypothetical protein